MKRVIAGLIFLFINTLNAQEMKTAEETISRLFVNTDQQNWSTVESCFADAVLLDYSSMTGNPAGTLSPKDITDAWKTILPGFEHTHHQVGNYLTTTIDNNASVFCYGTATHYLEDEGGNVWTVVGSYDFKLQKDEKDEWKVAQMKFNFKYQDGNSTLAQKAMEKVKNQK